MGSIENVEPLSSIRDYITILEAARFLDRSEKTIRRYINVGVLPARRFKGRGKKHWVNKHDLIALKEMRNKMSLISGNMLDLLKTIRIKLGIIEKRLNFLMEVNGLNVSELRDVSDKDLVKLYDEACDFLDVPMESINLKQIESWAKIFYQISELELVRMIGPCSDIEPWKPFYNLCIRMMSALYNSGDFSADAKLQEIYQLLERSRRNIVQAAVIFDENFSTQFDKSFRHKIHYKIHFPTNIINELDQYIAAEAGVNS
jgi:hypothetical protein